MNKKFFLPFVYLFQSFPLETIKRNWLWYTDRPAYIKYMRPIEEEKYRLISLNLTILYKLKNSKLIQGNEEQIRCWAEHSNHWPKKYIELFRKNLQVIKN